MEEEAKKKSLKKYLEGDVEFLRKSKDVLNHLKKPKVAWTVILVLLFIIIFWSASIRLSNLPILKDTTTGDTIPSDLDTFYFLRIAQTILDEGKLPEFDSFRRASGPVPYTQEILPQTTVLLYKVINIFSEKSLGYVFTITPVIFFIISLILFFFLSYNLTKNKIVALLSSFFLAFVPSFLFRTLAGSADHDSFGIMAFFAVLLVFVISLKYLQREKEKKLSTSIYYGLITAFLTAFAVVCWGGVVVFLYIIIPLSILIFWILNLKNNPNKKDNLLIGVYYWIWFLFSSFFGIIYGLGLLDNLQRYSISSSGIISIFTFLFLIVDYLFYYFKNKLNQKSKEYRIILSFVATILIGIIFLFVIGKNPFEIISEVFLRFLHPYGKERIGLTVAENAQPYLRDFISQIGKIFFWISFVGTLFLGYYFVRGVKDKKQKRNLLILWILMIVGLILTRVSSTSIFNGENFLSKLLYFGGIILFAIYFLYIYFKGEINVDSSTIILFSWMVIMFVAARGAVRLFFVLTPFICFLSAYSVYHLWKFAKNAKEEITKFILYFVFLLVIIGLIISLTGFISGVSAQAKVAGPSASAQWQNAMGWVRENTLQDDLFVHWWDYGYWVQGLGKRATLVDGGHGNCWDHEVGRYLLTTPYPETAFSFIKTHNISYLLIDQTDINKYPAFSIIGSDKSGKDRLSWINTFILDSTQVKETKEGLLTLYRGGTMLDQSLTYKDQNNTTIFLPESESGIGAILIETKNNSVNSAKGIFIYKNQQYQIPLRYVYYDQKFIDLGEGLDVTLYFYPLVIQTEEGINLNKNGAVMYLSGKVKDSLFAQVYLMDDPLKRFKELELVHTEDDYIVGLMKTQGGIESDFVYFGGVRGPIKIWKAKPNENIQVVEKFLGCNEFASLDNETFIKN